MRAQRSYGGGVGKTEEEKGDERRWHKLYMMARKQEEATQESSPRQRNAKDGHALAWKQQEAHRRRQLPAGIVPQNYKIATRFKTQITPKFMQQLKNLQK